MQIHNGLQSLPDLVRPCITTGTFDGVHVGHRKILERLLELSAMHKGESVVITFEPHPRSVLFPENHGLQLLTTLDEKAKLLQEIGVEHLLVLPFTVEFSKMDSNAFVKQILHDILHVHTFVIGYDHQFGHNREGNFGTIVLQAAKLGFNVEEIPPQDLQDIRVSSTQIRKALAMGDVKTAAALLTYPYSFDARVVHGRRIGRKLGFPTANLSPLQTLKQIPANGVYAVRVSVSGKWYNGMMNIGLRPTFSSSDKSQIEVHLLDFNADLYGQLVTVVCIQRIRDELKFENTNDLMMQLHLDKAKAKEWATR
jgi:riboflavin kinase/FMN adenylyltransferase